jgi:hypothetical protein
MDMQRRFPIVGFATEHFNRDVFLTGLGDDRVKHLVTAVKKLKVLTGGHAQNAPTWLAASSLSAIWLPTMRRSG